MSDESPDDPSSEDPFGLNPDGNDMFAGMPPMIRDLFTMMQNQGPLPWDAAKQFAYNIAVAGGSEGNVDPIERIKIEQLARVAELKIADVTGLPVSTTGSGMVFLPCNRTVWVQRTLDDYQPYFELLAGSLQKPGVPGLEMGEPDGGDPFAWMAPLMKAMGPMMLSLTAGSMVGHLSTRALGQYDLPIPRPKSDELLMVVTNLVEFGEQWSLPGDDLRLWVCLSEICHHTVLNIPHVRARLDSMLRAYLSAFDAAGGDLGERFEQLDVANPGGMQDIQRLFADPQVLLGAIQSPEQVEMLPQIDALVTAIVGYVDHVMDEAGGGLIGSYPMVTEALRRRRVEASSSDQFVEQLFGLDLTQKHYEKGGAFIKGIVERAGKRGLERLWRSERELPTPAEIDAPGLWLARIDLPD